MIKGYRRVPLTDIWWQPRHWPWQLKTGSTILDVGSSVAVEEKWGWRPRGGMGRFGGGWNWKLGIAIGSKTIIIALLFGIIRVQRGMPSVVKKELEKNG